MVSVFVDTSALYALLDTRSTDHNAAREEWRSLRHHGVQLRTHSYVVLEAAALIQRRLGMEAASDLHRSLLVATTVRWVDQPLHSGATTALLAAGRRQVSLVDWTSFEMMRAEHLTEAFAFDAHFAEQGFTLRPAE